MTPNLSGFRPEPPDVAEQHWSFSQIRTRVLAAIGGGDVPLGNFASDMRPFSSPRHNQLSTSSCVAQSMIKALEIKRIQKYGFGAHVDLSRLALYYLGRELMSPEETRHDDGMYVSMAADALRRFGICREVDWPFDEKKLFTPPTWSAMRKAYVHKISAWYRIGSTGIDRVGDVITSLAVGTPVVYGTVVGDNWLNYGPTDVLQKVDGAVRGRHATVLVGWQPELYGGVFIGENSWSAQWGDDGFYYIAPEVIGAFESSDFIAIAGSWDNWGTP
jgi:C1A family cysteine protease